VSLTALKRAGLLGLAAAALLSATAGAALVEVDGLVLRANGGFQPQALPRHRYAPIHFRGHFDIGTKRGAEPQKLEQAVIKFDRDGRLDVTGLPRCAPEKIAAADTEQARRICRRAIVGTGTVGAKIPLGFGTVNASVPLTVFNGPRLDGNPTAILHAQTLLPFPETYAIVAPIERQAGRYRYRVTIDVPPIAGGFGRLTRLEVSIGRRYRSGGRERSYVSARCTDNVLETHGHFTFDGGTVIDGDVEKYCRIL